jgi:NAD(P)-dependent dehydrogenase (short-subunit alcohol dehydrogenase family)
MPPKEMTGRVCLVTGASSGIGRATAKGLAAAGAFVVIVCRDETRGRSAQLEAMSDGPSDYVDLKIADLSSLASVRNLAADFGARYSKLDVLINNAGVYIGKRVTTAEGLEQMFATNYLGPFLLTRLLLPKLEVARPSKIINVTAPSTQRPEFDDLQGKRRFSPLRAFGASKAADLLFTYALDRKLKGRGVAAVAYHPGLVRTKLMREAPAPIRLVTGIANRFAGVSAERAAEGLVKLASAVQTDEFTGMLVRDGRTIEAPFRDDLIAQDRLWKISCKLVGLDEGI